MQRMFVFVFLIFACAAFSGCTNVPLNGAIYTESTASIHSRSGGSVIGPGAIERRGESCSWSTVLLGIAYVWYGDGHSVQAAKEQARITNVAVIDYSSTNVLGPLYYRNCVVVWGN